MEYEQMLPRRPYLFRAIYDWILDNQLTPYILVNTTVQGVQVPRQFIQNNQIVLNIAPHSVGQYLANNDRIEFNARFSGVSEHIIVPMEALVSIYTRENGMGMGFHDEPQYEMQREKSSNPTTQTDKKPANPFRVIK